MADEKRTVQSIQEEYSRACVRAGHIQYQLFTLGKDLELINNSLRDLNIEAATLKSKEDEAKNEQA